MELIKIYNPLKECMDGTLNEQECDELYDKIMNVVESEDMTKAFKENFKEDYEAQLLKEDSPAAGMILVAGIVVITLISKIISWIKNKYSINIKKLLDQSKELNDIYTKVDDLLKHDKLARLKHANDRVNYELHQLVMQDKATSKVYRIQADNLVYNPDYFAKQINDMMAYINGMDKKDKSSAIQTKTADLMRLIRESFMQNHGFVVTCEPLLRIEKIKNVRLEDAVMSYKSEVAYIYNCIYVINQNVSVQLQYMQVLQQSYQKLINTYGKDKEAKDAIDKIYKQLIKNSADSMDFNNKVATIFNEMIKFYSDELHKVYEIIRS